MPTPLPRSAAAAGDVVAGPWPRFRAGLRCAALFVPWKIVSMLPILGSALSGLAKLLDGGFIRWVEVTDKFESTWGCSTAARARRASARAR